MPAASAWEIGSRSSRRAENTGSTTDPERSRAEHRRSRLPRFSATLLFVPLAAAVIVALSWLSYRSVRDALVGEFSRRLENQAVTGAAQVSAADVREAQRFGEEATGYIALQVLLEQLKTTPGTWNASLLDSARRVIYDGRASEPEQPSPLDTLARPALERALAGLSTTSSLFRHGGRTLAAGLAPVTDSTGRVIAVLAVETPPSYWPLLDEFRRNLALVTAILLVALGGFLVVRTRFERRSAELERRLSRAENLAAMGRLTATLAHEIKNPLAIIRGSAQRLGRLEPEAQRMADFVVEESDRLSATVARYLQFARPAAAGEGATRAASTGDAAGALQATLDLLQGELEARKVTLEREGATGDPIPVRLDNESLKQVFLNLILNALDAMPDGGTLRVALDRRRDQVEIVIADTGPGIPEETLRQLGDPFVTTKARGSGLGLFLTLRLVQSAGGALAITSPAGRGTTCVITMPRTRG